MRRIRRRAVACASSLSPVFVLHAQRTTDLLAELRIIKRLEGPVNSSFCVCSRRSTAREISWPSAAASSRPCAHRAVPILDVTRFVRRAGGCRRWAIRKWAGGLRWSWWSWWSSPPGRGQGERPGQVALAQQAKARRLPLSLRPSFSVEVHRSEPGSIIISSSGPAAGSTACPGRGMVTGLKEPASVAARPNIFARSPAVMQR